MRSWHVLALFALSLVVQIDGVKYNSFESAMVQENKKLGGQLMRLPVQLFMDYVVSGKAHEKLNVITIMTAVGDCEPCRDQVAKFENSAKLFHRLHGFDSGFLFVNVEIDPNQALDGQVAGALGLEFVPIVYNFKPTRGGNRPQIRKGDSEMLPVDVPPDTSVINSYIAMQTSRVMPSVMNGPIHIVPILVAYEWTIIAAVIAVLAFCAKRGLYREKNFWMVIVFIVFCFSISGGHYDLIQSAPLLVFSNGVPLPVSLENQRNQFVLEGLLWCSFVGVVSILMLSLRDVAVQESVTRQHVLWCISMVATMYAIFGITSRVFSVKTPGYLKYAQ
ncbi:hypothetical protein NDN08_003695 [Rhodosorus marinus]|uniref:Magnesium transporter protein 1 n=1 Tax=Rhodosorus marinus TaxID=101924 RepID=A0AAV8UXJ3_9RHOD|nr:hypothetical protein NDN08_003695 [Rhodosorus marinus]